MPRNSQTAAVAFLFLTVAAQAAAASDGAGALVRSRSEPAPAERTRGLAPPMDTAAGRIEVEAIDSDPQGRTVQLRNYLDGALTVTGPDGVARDVAAHGGSRIDCEPGATLSLLIQDARGMLLAQPAASCGDRVAIRVAG